MDQFKGREICRFNLGHDFGLERELKIFAFFKFTEIDVRLNRGRKATVFEGIIDDLADFLIDRLAHDRLTKALTQDLDRRFARAEPGQGHRRRHFLQAIFNSGVNFASFDHHFVLALKAFGQRFRHLHPE